MLRRRLRPGRCVDLGLRRAWSPLHRNPRPSDGPPCNRIAFPAIEHGPDRTPDRVTPRGTAQRTSRAYRTPRDCRAVSRKKRCPALDRNAARRGHLVGVGREAGSISRCDVKKIGCDLKRILAACVVPVQPLPIVHHERDVKRPPTMGDGARRVGDPVVSRSRSAGSAPATRRPPRLPAVRSRPVTGPTNSRLICALPAAAGRRRLRIWIYSSNSSRARAGREPPRSAVARRAWSRRDAAGRGRADKPQAWLLPPPAAISKRRSRPRWITISDAAALAGKDRREAIGTSASRRVHPDRGPARGWFAAPTESMIVRGFPSLRAVL